MYSVIVDFHKPADYMRFKFYSLFLDPIDLRTRQFNFKAAQIYRFAPEANHAPLLLDMHLPLAYSIILFCDRT
jgi:hypothetical protein